MRVGMRLAAGLLLCAVGCKPAYTDYLDVTVQLGTGLTSKCVKVTADDQSTEPMLTANKTTLRVLVLRKDLPASVTVQARGYSDEACTVATGEQSPPTTAAFAQRTITLMVERGTGADLDSDGVPSPADCNDQDPTVKPGATEQCSDDIDNDCSGDADCKDPACHQQTCGAGSRCDALTCKEENCSDSIDGDGDGQSDCNDPDCNGRACGTGTGASCMGTTCAETACSDTTDNDLDGLTDCQEASCDTAACGTNGVCEALACKEPTESLCGDGADNDGDTRIDCADSDCNAALCNDNDGCTTGETCGGNTCRNGVAVVCNTPPGACFQSTGACLNGQCRYAPEPNTTVCSDGNACTTPDRCAGDGGCGSTPVVCPSPPANGCFAQGVCQPALDGGCAYAVLAAASCNDGDNCTTGDSCGADGGCQGTMTSCPPAECKVFTPGNCAADGGCLYTDAPVNTPCGGGRCDGAGTCAPNPTFTFAPDNVMPQNHLPAIGATSFTVDCALSFSSGPDAGFSALCSGMQAPAVSIADGGLAGELAVISVPTMFVTDAGSITISGSRPVVFLVWGDAGIDGPVLANSNASRPGPGALPPIACGTRMGGPGKPAGGQNGGGGGAGYLTNGGTGGLGNGGAGSGGDAGIAIANGDAPLLPGCPGGSGRTDSSFIPGGVGGGAVQLSVSGSLTVNAAVSVSGQGGNPATGGGDPGGGGGGSGGALVLQARQLTVTANAKLTSNGGAGGGGAQGGTATRGSDGSTLTDAPAQGGAKESNGGDGGNGGARGTPPTDGNSGSKGGGGAGGSAGRVFLKNVGTGCSVSGSAIISPDPTRTNCP
jgi:hypothetical protein